MKPFPIALSTLLAVLVITVGVAIRLTNINQPLLEFFPPRQTQTAEITRNIYVNGWPDFWTPKVRYFTPPQAEQTGEPIPYVLEFPLYNGLVTLLYHVFGPNVIWGRILSLVFFALSGIVFYRLVTSSIIHHPSSIYALLFFTFSPLHILISRSFQPEELALFLLLLAVYKKSWFIFSLAVLTKLPIALFVPVLFYASSRAQPRDLASETSDINSAKDRSLDSLRSLEMTIKGILSLLPSLIWYYRASKLTIHPTIARNFELSNWFQPQLWLDPNWYFSLFQIEHIWVLTTLGLLFFWLGFWKIVAVRRLLAVRQGVSLLNTNIWIIWLVSGFFYLTIFNYHAMTHEYYHLFLLPPLSAIAGLGLASIYSNVAKHRSKSIFTAGIILMLIGSLSLPAIRKIISVPKYPQDSTEITTARYRLIEDF